MRRCTALLLMLAGQSALALLAPSVAALPAFAVFLVAAAVLAK